MMKGMVEGWMKSEGGEVCVHVTRDRECDVISNSKKREVSNKYLTMTDAYSNTNTSLLSETARPSSRAYACCPHNRPCSVAGPEAIQHSSHDGASSLSASARLHRP
jgi:hypothetical protein